jgi:hypothetical protein
VRAVSPPASPVAQQQAHGRAATAIGQARVEEAQAVANGSSASSSSPAVNQQVHRAPRLRATLCVMGRSNSSPV